MNIAGIIAEYNPFHSGHKRHVELTRESGASHIVAVMSGSMVQRGEVAVLDPHERARAAVAGGVDLVLELAPQFALGAARDFARAGVGILSRLGCVNVLSFGAECPDVEALKNALSELESGELEIKALMSRGKTYPQAAAEVCKSAAKIISGQNNTLALEYLRALRGSGISPLAVERTVMHDAEKPKNGFASAAYIRELLRRSENVEEYLGAQPNENALSFCENGERAILFRLSQLGKEDFKNTPYCKELAGRLYEASRRAESLDEIYRLVKPRNVTQARVRRAVMLAALGITLDDVKQPAFARVLALNEKGAEILHLCRKTADIPLGGSLSALSRISPEAKRQAEIIELASRLQQLCRKTAQGVSEFRKSARMIG